jgi:hypothetical protein
MAISLAFGVAFATTITLLVLPAGFVILDDLASGLRRLLGREAPALAVEPKRERPARVA